MDVATSFLPLLQVFAVAMTQPMFQNLMIVATGWVFAPRRTVCGMVRASGTTRHHAMFHRLFASAGWSIDRVGFTVFDLVTSGMQTVFLCGDDTLLSRSGTKVFGTGMHRDAVLSSRSHTVVRWGHCWVVLCVIVESRWVPGRRFAVPVLCRLYLSHQSAEKWKWIYRKKTELMLAMLRQLEQHAAQRPTRLHFMGDSAYTAPAVLAQMPKSIAITGRVGETARLYAPPAARRAGQKGRPRQRGERLASPREMLQQDGLRRMTLKLYEGKPYRVRVAEQLARFYYVPDREVKIVAIEHLHGGRGVEVFYTTQPHQDGGAETTAEMVLTQYSWRWPIEVMFHDAKQHLGIDEPQNRTPRAACRTAPVGFLLYSLIVWWHEMIRTQPARTLRFWTHKRSASFAEMLAALRSDSLENAEKTLFATPDTTPGVKKLFDKLKELLLLGA
jgi:hypothetical protein